MARNAHNVIAAPTGYDSTTTPTSLPENRAAKLANLLCDRAGQLRAAAQITDVLSGFSLPVDGVAWYYSVSGAADQLLIVSGGVLYAAQSVSPPTFPPAFTNPVAVGGGFAMGKRVRSVAYRTEILFTQDGGIQPLRYNGKNLYQLGMTPPAAPTGIYNASPAGGATKKISSITYKAAYYDEFFRESDLSTGLVMNYAANAGTDGQITVSFGSDPQVQGVNLYATTSGGATNYRIAQLPKAAGVATFEDNLPDATVNTGIQSALLGKNALPLPASVIAVHKLRIWMDVANDPARIQFSSLDSVTAFSSTNYTASDGQRVTLTSDAGNKVTGLVPVGSTLVILRRRLLYLVYGDDPDSFTFRSLETRSAIVPDSAVRCDNALFYLSDDFPGVYLLKFDGSFLTEKISKEIETELLAAPRPLLETSVAAYAYNTYWIQVGGVTYGYNFDAGGWLQLTQAGGVSGMTVAIQQGQNPLLYVARSDKNAVSVLDVFSSAQTVPGVFYQTAAFSFGSQERPRATRHRCFRTTVYGSGRLAGTLTLTVDGVRTQTAPALDGDAGRGILCRQQWGPEMVGTRHQLTLAGTGTNLVITDVLAEGTEIG